MEVQTAALVEEVPAANHSAVSEDTTSGPQEDAARFIHYPRAATVFAAVASIIFIFVGILGKLICYLLKFFHKKKARLPPWRPEGRPARCRGASPASGECRPAWPLIPSPSTSRQASRAGSQREFLRMDGREVPSVTRPQETHHMLHRCSRRPQPLVLEPFILYER